MVTFGLWPGHYHFFHETFRSSRPICSQLTLTKTEVVVIAKRPDSLKKGFLSLLACTCTFTLIWGAFTKKFHWKHFKGNLSWQNHKEREGTSQDGNDISFPNSWAKFFAAGEQLRLAPRVLVNGTNMTGCLNISLCCCRCCLCGCFWSSPVWLFPSCWPGALTSN